MSCSGIMSLKDVNPYKVIVKNDDTGIYNSAYTLSGRTATVNKMDTVVVIGVEGLFYFVQFGNSLQGYVNKSDVLKIFDKNKLEKLFPIEDNVPILSSDNLFSRQIDVVNKVDTLFKIAESWPYANVFVHDTVFGFVKKEYMSTIQQKEVIEKIRRSKPLTNKYLLFIVDINEHPISEAKIEYSLLNNSITVKEAQFLTASNGLFLDTLLTTLNKNDYFSTELKYSISKPGYYSATGKLELNNPENPSPDNLIKSKTIRLIQPIDYFSSELLSSKDFELLKSKILLILNDISLPNVYEHSYLEHRSINLIEFKSKKYLTFTFRSIDEFNLLKLNKYDIAKRFFDNIVRQVLEPLDLQFFNTTLFYGYDIKIIGSAKSFADEYASAQEIIYRFLIPNETVKSYKDKDISSQTLLDNSIILMDDDRIELLLQ
jgi:hypothetical protein